MNQSFFKEILEQEIHSVFLTPAEFGESVTLEGKTLDAVVDRPEMAWPEADDRRLQRVRRVGRGPVRLPR